MIPRLRPSISGADLAAAFLGRTSVQEFEAAFASLMGQQHAVAFAYGRSGLMLLLEVLGLKDVEIICPAYTCVVVAHAIVRSGNKPVFIDSRAGDFNMDLDQAEAAIGRRTGALIATSIHGYPVDLERLDQIRARNPGLIIIQDCAHSFAAKWKGRPVQREGHAAIFGLNISKSMTSIFGGMVTTDDADLARRLRSARQQRLQPATWLRSLSRAIYLVAATAALFPPAFTVVDKIRRLGLIDRFTEYYDEDVVDMPRDYLMAMSAAEASVGRRQTQRYHALIEHRCRIATVYDEALAACRSIRRPPLVPGATYSHYVACVDQPEALVADVARHGVELGRLIDYCVPDMPAYRNETEQRTGFPVTRALNASVINLPLHVTEKQARDIAALVTSTLDARRDRNGHVVSPSLHA